MTCIRIPIFDFIVDKRKHRNLFSKWKLSWSPRSWSNLWEPVKARRGVKQVYAPVGKESPMEWTCSSSHEAAAQTLSPSHSLTLLVETLERDEDGIEIIPGEVVQEHLDLRQGPAEPSASLLDAVQNVGHNGKGVRARRTTKVSYSELVAINSRHEFDAASSVIGLTSSTIVLFRKQNTQHTPWVNPKR